MTKATSIASAAERIAAQKRGGQGKPTLSAVEMDRMRTLLATEFGRRRGWTYRQYDRIAPGDLSGRWTPPDAHHLVDNAYTFRHPDGSPAAVVGHVYKGDREDVRQGLAARGRALGLRVSYPTDVPSWWYPGRTTLVLFEHPGGRMPVLRPLEDEGDDWWSGAKREPFDRRDVLRREPWPSEADALAGIKAMAEETRTHRHVLTVTIERLHILHEGHPSKAVRLAAACALPEREYADSLDGEDA